ncbi:hypothetical protein BKA56DRAFT_573131 [Ilyonectria sp. MPI-CAGE-AT-0026]|nr:hypothetical protein BKA56DRAFT_573131 [Ilyonectria sp. MPI-CAGE-AT-0026]
MIANIQLILFIRMVPVVGELFPRRAILGVVQAFPHNTKPPPPPSGNSSLFLGDIRGVGREPMWQS